MQRLLLLWCGFGAIALAVAVGTQAQASDLEEDGSDSDGGGDGGDGSGSGGGSVLDFTSGGAHAAESDGGNAAGGSTPGVLDFSTQHPVSSSSGSSEGPSGSTPVSDGKPNRHHRRHGDDDDDDDDDGGKGGGEPGGAGGLDFGSLTESLHKDGDKGVDNLIKALSAVKMANMDKLSVGKITKDENGNDVYDLRSSASTNISLQALLAQDGAASTTLAPAVDTEAAVQDGAASTTSAPAVVSKAPHAAPLTPAAPLSPASPPAQQQRELSPQPHRQSAQSQELASSPQAVTTSAQQTAPLSQLPAVPKEQSRAEAEPNTAPGTQPAQSSQLQPPRQSPPELAHHVGTKHHHRKKHHHHHRGNKSKGLVTVDPRPLLVGGQTQSPGTPVARPSETNTEPVKRGLPEPLPAGTLSNSEHSTPALLPVSQSLVSLPMSAKDPSVTLPTGKMQEQAQVSMVASSTARSRGGLPMQQDVQSVAPGSSSAVDLSRGLYAIRQNLDELIRQADSLTGHTAVSTPGQIQPVQALSSASATVLATGSDAQRPIAASGQIVQPSLVSANGGEFLRRLQVLEQEHKNEAMKLQSVEAIEKKDEQRIAALEKENRLLRGLVLGRHR